MEENRKVKMGPRYGWTEMGEMVCGISGEMLNNREIVITIDRDDLNLDLLGDIYAAISESQYNKHRGTNPKAKHKHTHPADGPGAISLSQIVYESGPLDEEAMEDIDKFIKYGLLEYAGLEFKEGTYVVQLGPHIEATGELHEGLIIEDMDSLVTLYLNGILTDFPEENRSQESAIIQAIWDDEQGIFIAQYWGNVTAKIKTNLTISLENDNHREEK